MLGAAWRAYRLARVPRSAQLRKGGTKRTGPASPVRTTLPVGSYGFSFLEYPTLRLQAQSRVTEKRRAV